MRVLSRNGPFICDKCGSKYPTRSAFQAHNYRHHGCVTFCCDLCPRSFIQKRILGKHIKQVHLKFQPFQCKNCEYNSFEKGNLNKHMKLHGSKSECKVCHEFVTSLKMKNHLKTHWKDLRTCSVCQKVFVNRFSLKNHFKAVHFRSTRMFCDLCPKVYFTKQSISSHMRTVHSKKLFACNVCDYKTASKNHLSKHKMTHTEKIECPICKKHVSVLKAHMESHNPKVSCPICQKVISKIGMTTHMNRTHKKIKCKDCDAIFDIKKDLRRFVMLNLFSKLECFMSQLQAQAYETLRWSNFRMPLRISIHFKRDIKNTSAGNP